MPVPQSKNRDGSLLFIEVSHSSRLLGVSQPIKCVYTDNIDGVSAATRLRAKPNSRQHSTESEVSRPSEHDDVAA